MNTPNILEAIEHKLQIQKERLLHYEGQLVLYQKHIEEKNDKIKHLEELLDAANKETEFAREQLAIAENEIENLKGAE